MRRRLAAGVLAVSALTLAACTQNTATTQGSGPKAKSTVKQATAEKPEPFASGDVKVALVRQSGAGDYFEQWGNGAKKQAELIGMGLEVYDAQADNAKQATDMETAINSGVDGIVVDHGLAETMNPLIDKAIDKGIPVVVYDVAVENDKAVNTLQDDHAIAGMVLDEMAKAVPDGSKVGYVNILGIAPLDRRHEVWVQRVEENNWEQAFMVGKFTNAVATDNCRLVDAALKANTDIKAIFAPYDELAKAAVCGVQNNDLEDKVKVYGVDISTADIQKMTAEGSPWVVTAGTDPKAVGAAVLRVMAKEIAGQQEENKVVFPASLITQDFLREEGIANMGQLRAALPELDLADVATAGWIPQVTY